MPSRSPFTSPLTLTLTFTFALPFTSALLTGCSAGTVTPDDQNAPPADLTSSSALDLATAGGYPAGPYGATVGSTIAPLVWEGYVDLDGAVVATAEPFGPYSMDALRTGGARYAMVHVAEFY